MTETDNFQSDCHKMELYFLNYVIISSGGSRKLGTGGGRNRGALRQNQVLAVCTERSTGKSAPPPSIIMALNGGGGGARWEPPT